MVTKKPTEKEIIEIQNKLMVSEIISKIVSHPPYKSHNRRLILKSYLVSVIVDIIYLFNFTKPLKSIDNIIKNV